jgi:hypothetical protein
VYRYDKIDFGRLMDVEDGKAVEAQSQFPRDSSEFRRSRMAFEAVTSRVGGGKGHGDICIKQVF